MTISSINNGNRKALVPFRSLSFFCVQLISIVVSLCMMNSALAQDIQVGEGAASRPAVQSQSQSQVNQTTQMAQDLSGIQEKEMTVFDPDTVPDAPESEQGQWVFSVPVQVSNLADEVQRIGVVCQTFHYVFKSEGWLGAPDKTKKDIIGTAKKRIDLINGNFSGDVSISVNPKEGKNPSDAEEYECFMYLIDQDNNWKEPCMDCVSWRQPDPYLPFTWKTGKRDLP